MKITNLHTTPYSLIISNCKNIFKNILHFACTSIKNFSFLYCKTQKNNNRVSIDAQLNKSVGFFIAYSFIYDTTALYPCLNTIMDSALLLYFRSFANGKGGAVSFLPAYKKCQTPMYTRQSIITFVKTIILHIGEVLFVSLSAINKRSVKHSGTISILNTTHIKYSDSSVAFYTVSPCVKVSISPNGAMFLIYP